MAEPIVPPSIIFVPEIRRATFWQQECLDFCAQEHSPVLTIAHTWDDVVAELQQHPRVWIVAGRKSHIPPDRLPRIRIVRPH